MASARAAATGDAVVSVDGAMDTGGSDGGAGEVAGTQEPQMATASAATPSRGIRSVCPSGAPAAYDVQTMESLSRLVRPMVDTTSA